MVYYCPYSTAWPSTGRTRPDPPARPRFAASEPRRASIKRQTLTILTPVQGAPGCCAGSGGFLPSHSYATRVYMRYA